MYSEFTVFKFGQSGTPTGHTTDDYRNEEGLVCPHSQPTDTKTSRDWLSQTETFSWFFIELILSADVTNQCFYHLMSYVLAKLIV